jgi:D-galactarolactone cycloisomerase
VLRRDVLTLGGWALGSFAISAAGARTRVGMRARITEVRLQHVKVVRELGIIDNTNFIQGMKVPYRVGGYAFTEIMSDQGLIGIGPGMPPDELAKFRSYLIGKDPFDIAQHVQALAPVPTDEVGRPPARSYVAACRAFAAAEIALWDLIGKLAGQPLYKLWGGAKGRVRPYCSYMMTGDAHERGALSAEMSAQGWPACKLRISFPTIAEDLAVVDAVRKATGDNFLILCDGNKAYGNLVPWDVSRVTATAYALKERNVYWLEEPCLQYNLQQLAILRAQVGLPLAGAEGTVLTQEFMDQVQAHAYDILNCEVASNGPSKLRQIQALAQPFGIRVVPHFGDGMLATFCQLHLVASWSNAELVEIINDPPIADYAAQWSIFESAPAVTKDGYLDMPETPGLGVTIRRDLITT